jgi:Fe2+ or Zn2+ uptake regulation protein
VLFDVDVPVALIARHVAAEQSGFDITSHHTVFAGICPACKTREALGSAGEGKASTRRR